ncbi:hypothetical protein FTUN_4515 [Frigoriglobus tundricola]|uniref:Uncharacterized protein n=1 Tax=Frigoriglobus tundricola TaxID=2774151 RepID=A0A6M5YSC8_9BACT|nr:hypothetical protein FTUN_4515 [Frigoriglobus tundricola]
MWAANWVSCNWRAAGQKPIQPETLSNPLSRRASDEIAN